MLGHYLFVFLPLVSSIASNIQKEPWPSADTRSWWWTMTLQFEFWKMKKKWFNRDSCTPAALFRATGDWDIFKQVPRTWFGTVAINTAKLDRYWQLHFEWVLLEWRLWQPSGDQVPFPTAVFRWTQMAVSWGLLPCKKEEWLKKSVEYTKSG